MTVGTRLPAGFAATSPALVVAGTHGSYNLQKGSAYLTPESGVNFNGGSGTGYLSSNPIDFATAFGHLRTLSTQWGAAAATGTASAGVTGGNNALVLTGSSASLNVFNLSTADAAALASGRHLGLSVPTGSVTIINVPGRDADHRRAGLAGQRVELEPGQRQQRQGRLRRSGLELPRRDRGHRQLRLGLPRHDPGARAPRSRSRRPATRSARSSPQSFASGYETHQNLFPGEACVPSPPSTPGTSDVTITKSASSATPHRRWRGHLHADGRPTSATPPRPASWSATSSPPT